jgi:hydroxymethylglutaryl-CoA reductase
VEKGLHTTPERMCDYWRMSFIGGVQTGSIGVSGHVANGLTALFIACGQDVACVSEAAVGVTRMELTDGGDLYAAVNLPNLIVGTVGGGTRLPTARECLRIVDCDGAGTPPPVSRRSAPRRWRRAVHRGSPLLRRLRQRPSGPGPRRLTAIGYPWRQR